MRLRPVAAAFAFLAGLLPAAGAVAQNGPVDPDLLKAFTFRNMHPFRLGARIADIAVPVVPAKDHLYTIRCCPNLTRRAIVAQIGV